MLPGICALKILNSWAALSGHMHCGSCTCFSLFGHSTAGVASRAVTPGTIQGFLVSLLSSAAPKYRPELCIPQHHCTPPPCPECFSWFITAAPVLTTVCQVDVTMELADPVLKQVNKNKSDNYLSRKNVSCDSFMN